MILRYVKLFEDFSTNESIVDFQSKLKSITNKTSHMRNVNTKMEFIESGMIQLLNQYKKDLPALEKPIKMINDLLNINEIPGRPNTQRIELRRQIYNFLNNEVPKLINNKNSNQINTNTQNEYSKKYPKMTRGDIQELNKEFDRLLNKYPDNKELDILYNQYLNGDLKDMDIYDWEDKIREIFKK